MLMNYTKGLVDAFTFVILLATLTTLVPYAFSAAAQAYLWLVEREQFNPKHLVRDVVDRRRSRSPTRVWAIAGAGEDIVDQGLRAPAGRHPGLRRDALVAGTSRSRRSRCSRRSRSTEEPKVLVGAGDAR